MALRRNTYIVLACLVGTSVLFWLSNAPVEAASKQEEQALNWKDELQRLDQEIQQSEDAKNRYLAAARRAEDQGMRWQFMQDQKQEAKRAFKRAEDNKKAAEMLQARIDFLTKQKEQLLKEHPEAK